MKMKNKMIEDLIMALTHHDLTHNSRLINIDNFETQMLISERDYLENASRGHFGFMINPNFGKGVYT